MGRIWVLDTETKGTGAEMVPLESVRKSPRRREPIFVPRERAPREPEPTPVRAPRRFKVVDVTSRAVLTQDASARETLELLGGVRSSVDVHVYIWEDERWRLLTLPEQRVLWERRPAP